MFAAPVHQALSDASRAAILCLSWAECARYSVPGGLDFISGGGHGLLLRQLIQRINNLALHILLN